MKKIILFLATILVVSACCESTTTKSTIVEPKLERLILTDYGNYGIRKFKYENHSYIMVKGSGLMAIEHDPNCSCHKENLW